MNATSVFDLVPRDSTLVWPSEAALNARFDALDAEMSLALAGKYEFPQEKLFEMNMLLDLIISTRRPQVTAGYMHRALCQHYEVEDFSQFVIYDDADASFAAAWNNLQRLAS